MNPFLPGQRWVSETEPELGLGRVVSASADRVLIDFRAAGEQRQYAAEAAPLRRVRFHPGNLVQTGDGRSVRIVGVSDADGLIVYTGEEIGSLLESDLGDTVEFGSCEERLLQGHTDESRKFNLRCAALEHRHRRRQSAVRGLMGGRIDLIPHQLYIAGEVTGRQSPRVLLADEVGLGKTIEACLVVHRLLETGRASRILVVVPESLVHQWFVELLRRFNLWFHLYDEERCAAIEAAGGGANPFLDDQLVLCGLPLLIDSPRGAQAAEAGWDVLVVDEAHHLRWSPGGASSEYLAVEALSRRADGLLLLTATPEQLGLEGHFARLRLLDPDRYYDFAEFKRESAGYGDVAAIAHRLVEGESMTTSDVRRLHQMLGAEDSRAGEKWEALARGEVAIRQDVISALLDRHGTGRVMFRNTRSAIKGFPRRVPRLVPLEAGHEDSALLERLALEWDADVRSPCPEVRYEFRRDPRVAWVAEFLPRLRGGKALLICRTREKAVAIEDALRTRINVKTALFHEDLDLIQRDRQAAWFADPDGAQILIASEIGSEGRNFQFAHHLVLFDLPLDPELVEQRIGRLDRIGQTSDVQIHLPYVRNSAQEALVRWFHEGLNVFARSLHAGRQLLEEFGVEIRDLAQDFHETLESSRPELDALIARTKVARKIWERRLEEGRDRLLELHSFRPEPARALVNGVSELDEDRRLDEFLLEVWDHFGIPVEDLGPRRFKVGADGVFADRFPGLPPEGMVATLDRRSALSREDIAFLTWDHPMVTGALDLLLGGSDGTCACVTWAGAPQAGFWLEAVFVLECVAPPRLHADRFLPATPLRLLVDAQGKEAAGLILTALDKAGLSDLPLGELLDTPSVRPLIKRLVEMAKQIAETKAGPVIEESKERLARQLGGEVERLRSLAAINPNVRPAEIAATERQWEELRSQLESARVRLDALRVILAEPTRGGAARKSPFSPAPRR